MKKIKKGKIAVSITVGVVSFVLMAVMFMQFKVINQTDITSIETMRESELTTELASWKQRYEEAKEKYEDTQTKLEEYKSSEKSYYEEKNDTIMMTAECKNSSKYMKYKELYIDKNLAKPTKMEIKDDSKKTAIYILYNEVKY